MSRIHKLIVPIMLTMNLCACGSESIQKGSNIQNFEQNHYITHANTYQNGVIYTGSEGSPTAAYFLDYESMQAVPLCNKPNCAHKDTSCLAFQCVQDSIMPFVYQGMVYWFHTDSKITDSDDGRSTAYQFQTTCYCGNMTTGEVESFVEIPDVSMKDAIEFVISNHTLYIIGCDCAYQEEDGSWTEMSRIGDQYLYAINLDTADVKNYGLINDAPTASYNWTLNGAMFADVELTGIYQNKLYLSYRYVDDPNDIIDYVNTGDPDSPDWSDAGTAMPWHRVNKCLNLETDTIEPSEYPAADLIQDDTYIYYMDGQYHVMDADGTETVSADIPANNSRNLTFVNGIFWDGPQSTCFQPKTGETHVLSETYSDTNLTVIAYYKERYIINYTDENNLIHFEAVPESDLIGGIVE